MRAPSLQSNRSWLTLSAAIVVLLLVALLPWWKNHAYLTDFYDYGLVISGVGRLGAGERLYADIVSPIQSGIFLLNGAAEKIGGGTFQAITWGGAFLIAAATAIFALMLSRRWPVVAVMGVVAGIVCSSVSQHTIIWHNTVGVVCLALVVWGSALAPVLQRATWLWHLLVVAGLWLGGINKLNSHIVALAICCGWTLRAGLTGGQSWGRVTGTVAFWLVAGMGLPLLTELIWTGVPFSVWRYNVVELPLSSRAGALGKILTWQFYLATPHTYYGVMRLPQIGLVSIILALLTGCAAWRQNLSRGWGDRLLLIIAVGLALCAGAALHATNFDIAYIGLASALVLTVGLWLGFGLVPRGWLFWSGFVIPSLLVGAVGWESAWQGQRSQFGHSGAPREMFLRAETADPAYAYLRGTYLPPEMHASLGGAARWLHSIEHDGRYPVFYGPGIEWLERIFPAVKPGPMPLLAQWGATYGPGELQRLHDGLRSKGCYAGVLSVLAWDTWTTETAILLDFSFSKRLVGGVITLRERSASPPFLRDAFTYRNQFGGNAAAPALDLNNTSMAPCFDSDNRAFLGIVGGSARISVNVPIRRMDGEAVIHRVGGGMGEPFYADFHAVKKNSQIICWSSRLELSGDKSDVSLTFLADGNGEPLDLVIEIPPAFHDRISAGYRNPRITNTGDDVGTAPYLRPDKLADEAVDKPAVFLKTSWRPEKITLRGGAVGASGIELGAGGELWMYSSQNLNELSGEVALAPNAPGTSLPVVRVVWYKAGRFEVLQQETIRQTDGKIAFRAWSAEPSAWFGVLIDPVPGVMPALVRILKVEPSPP